MATVTDKITALARESGVRHADNLEPLTPAARRALNGILRDLDAEERETLVLLNAVGRWDWHLVDGTRRIWHLTAGGRISWNMLSDANEGAVLSRAERLVGREIG